MQALSLEQIRQATGGTLVGAGVAGKPADPAPWLVPPVLITGVTTDSRTAKPGELFVALRGARFDGHEFLAQAAAAGCAAAMVDRKYAASVGCGTSDSFPALPTRGDEKDLGSDQAGNDHKDDAWVTSQTARRDPPYIIVVEDTLAAMGALAAWCRQRLDAVVIAVTGSNGKTTTKRMIHHILSSRLKGSASPKSFNNNIGVPLTLLSVEDDDQYVVCELGSNAPGEIAALARIAQPDVAVITSVGQTHLEKLGSIEGVAQEKAALLKFSRPGGLAVLNADSQPLAAATAGCPLRRISFGEAASADLRLSAYEPTDDGGGRMQINGREWIKLSVPGRHMACNALAAMAVAVYMGFGVGEAASAMAGYRSQDMRLEVLQAGDVRIINDAYNANPASMRAAADVLSGLPASRRVMVVGDMLELGGQSAQLHFDLGRDIAAAGVDVVIGVGALGGQIAAGAGQAGRTAETIESVDAACRSLPGLLQKGDLVLLKGSRGMAMERLVEPIRRAFDHNGHAH